MHGPHRLQEGASNSAAPAHNQLQASDRTQPEDRQSNQCPGRQGLQLYPKTVQARQGAGAHCGGGWGRDATSIASCTSGVALITAESLPAVSTKDLQGESSAMRSWPAEMHWDWPAGGGVLDVCCLPENTAPKAALGQARCSKLYLGPTALRQRAAPAEARFACFCVSSACPWHTAANAPLALLHFYVQEKYCASAGMKR